MGLFISKLQTKTISEIKLVHVPVIVNLWKRSILKNYTKKTKIIVEIVTKKNRITKPYKSVSIVGTY